MKELSLNILDITQNSVTAKADTIEISLAEDDKGILTLKIIDNGCGMKPETVKSVRDPFCTSRKTRKVGLGIPFLKLAANQTGGDIEIISTHIDDDPVNHGTTVSATFDTHHIDFTPVGDMVETMITLISGNPDIDFKFSDVSPARQVYLDTKELKAVLGEDISLGEFEVLEWIKGYLNEQYSSIEQ